ncbi:MAG: DNA polymerase III subunit alpha [SAR202 cluster bacterium]|nr:DNA polymerase III subunit alpha [SAR202 cluster bacterium]RZP18589.1 MAG: DNA polymerase III subunit alpha [Chloroflexota bacterium]
MNSFVHLHNHSEYSLLDGMSNLSKMVTKVKENSQSAIAITDHGNMYGAVEFYKLAKQNDINPIIGLEAYVAKEDSLKKTTDEKSPYHLTLLSQNHTGYQNLMKLVTHSNLNGFYYKPRIDKKILEENSQGIIALSGCPSSELSRSIIIDDEKKTKETYGWFKEVFKDNFYLEIMEHVGVPHQKKINEELLRIHKANNIPYVITNDNHYVNQEDHSAHELLMCLQTNSNINDPHRFKFDDDNYHIKSTEEMYEQWGELTEGLRNTLVIAEKCNIELDFSKSLLPKYECPDGKSSMEYLRELTYKGFSKKFESNDSKLIERLEYELEVIEKTKFPDYFLVCWDIFNFVNSKKILSAVRGSAAASLVLYCLEVTRINPMEHNLVFERFLNLERREMPDIDMDFEDDKRNEVMKYCVDRYGKDHIAQIITFGTMGAKAAVRDVTRVLDLPISVGDKLAGIIPTRVGTKIKDAQEIEEFKSLQRDNDYKKVVDFATKLEGTIRHASTHAAGVIISQDNLTDDVPLQRSTSDDENAPPTTQYAMGAIADVGLLKMDFLGLTNLTIIGKTIELIEEMNAINFDIYSISKEDKNTFDLLSEGDTFGVFQLESAGMRKYIKDLKPSNVSDIAAMIALYRPGPMEHIDRFIRSKYGKEKIKYPHEALKEILSETYGIIVYQDQVLKIAQAFGGYTLGEADILRKAMGKKIKEVMQAQKDTFIKGSLKKGFDNDIANEIFELIEPFAGYAFNKAHSVSYAMIAYWTAYFKANYKVEYFTSLLNSYINNFDKISDCITEIRKTNIDVKNPHINHSQSKFSIEQDDNERSIRFGLSSLKNVGIASINKIINEREENGTFASLDDFCKRMDSSWINKKILESLIKSGSFDEFGDRGSLFDSVERILLQINNATKLRNSNQTTMFDLFGDEVETPTTDLELTNIKTEDTQKMHWEKEVLGISFTENPNHKEMLRIKNINEDMIVSMNQIDNVDQKKPQTIIAEVRSYEKRVSRKGSEFMIVKLELIDGVIDLMVWQNKLEDVDKWLHSPIAKISGKINNRNGDASIWYDNGEIFSFDEEIIPKKITQENLIKSEPIITIEDKQKEEKTIIEEFAKEDINYIKEVIITLDDQKHSQNKHLMDDITRILLDNEGKIPVSIVVKNNNEKVKLSLPFANVDASKSLEEKLDNIIGLENVYYKQ